MTLCKYLYYINDGKGRKLLLEFFDVEDLFRNTDFHVLLDFQLAGEADVIELFVAA